ncbi:MAG TPA: saccharopine dehydrogenase NADP-binding domain-containing protein [Fluviicoccus sp.]|nr:saccharopine dehydrogenase NADP-binding domain-containing protein [Fluviicoccus sp.]
MSQHHIVVFGATSFVGQILTHYLWQRHGLGGEVSWALAGRSLGKLEQVRASLGPQAAALPLIVADAANESELRSLCAQTRVIVSTVGPYALYGSPLVKVCAETGTDYCDLTGEVQWIARMIAEHETTAQKSGARIVHCCGFDSIPSDLGVHFLQQHATQKFGQPCSTIKLRIKNMRGGASGGTVASMLNVVQESVKDPSVRKLMSNPYALCPGVQGVRQPNVTLAEYDEDARSWLAPFVMAGINTRVVHRSNLVGGNYGADFRYDEAMMTGSGFKGRAIATGIGAGLAGFLASAALPPTRFLLEKVVPQPGEGPTPEEQEKGGYDFRFFGRTANGQKIVVKVTGDRDPGYGSTAKMLGEAAVCLALETDKAKVGGGFWTPATAFGDKLVKRLVDHAGLTFEVL